MSPKSLSADLILTTARAGWDCAFSQRLKLGPLGPSPPPSCVFWHPARDHTRQRSPTCQQGVLAHVSCIQIYRQHCSRDQRAGETRDSILPSFASLLLLTLVALFFLGGPCRSLLPSNPPFAEPFSSSCVEASNTSATVGESRHTAGRDCTSCALACSS
jgi:hypothetical protein